MMVTLDELMTDVCAEHNCQLAPHTEGWHAMHHHGTKDRVIEWLGDEWHMVK